MQFQTLRFTVDGDLGLVTLNRPAVLNAMDIPMAGELETLAENLRQRPNVGALVITGEGRAFCDSTFATELAPPLPLRKSVQSLQRKEYKSGLHATHSLRNELRGEIRNR